MDNAVTCPPQLTSQQIQSQVDNLKWNEQQQEISSAYARKSQDQQVQLGHEHYMVEHFYVPLVADFSVIIVALAIAVVLLRFFTHSVTKNRDNNASALDRLKETSTMEITKNRDDNTMEVQYAVYLKNKLEAEA